ncbi:MAG: hypothetical protein K2O69_01720 [Odoribacter sp.]|nr:hypothetical protein [Odoribacter sp.]
MKRLLGFILLFGGTLFATYASNVRITEAPWVDVDNIPYSAKRGTVYMTVEWDNSWRDNQNWDAVYVFLKSKRVTDIAWSHVLLRDNFHVLSDGYDYFMAKHPGGGTDNSIGIFIYRKSKGSGSSKVELALEWNYGAQGLTRSDFVNGLQYEAFAIEMVYIPKGPFRPGDIASSNTFRKKERQILPAWDLVTPSVLMSSSWQNCDANAFDPNYEDRGLEKICDRDNSSASSYWVSVETKTGLDMPMFTLDLGANKTIRYVAMELVSNDVISWDLYGGVKQSSTRPPTWTLIGTFMQNGGRTINSAQTYPIVAAYPVLKKGTQLNDVSYRYYKVQFNMAGANARAYVRSFSMTDQDISQLSNDSYIIDGNATTLPFGTTWNYLTVDGKSYSGSLGNVSNRIMHYAVGYEGFYTMKYEISQRQYVDFLNKLTADEQRLRTIGDALDDLNMGDYVYGASHKQATCRNGIVVGAMQDNRFAFACNLNPNNLYNQSDDGDNIACNFLSPKDMLAYASWSGLRPMSELEYEKMGRQTIDSVSAKVPIYTLGSYAWGSATVKLPSGSTISGSGGASEKLAGANINTGDKVLGPVRSGSFAAGTDVSAVNSGASYYGVMELSGNLAEIYYRAEPGKVLLSQELPSHGKGTLSGGEMHTDLNGYWGTPNSDLFASSMVLRGGHFRSESNRTRLGDREEVSSYSLAGLNRKDSTVTFRLGHSVTSYQTGDAEYYPSSWIQDMNGAKATAGVTVYDTICSSFESYTYKITGSNPREEGMVSTGEIRYAWYSHPGNGIWTLMEGKNSKDLTLTKVDLDHYTASYRTYSFKRRIYTPTQYSESGVVSLRVGTNRPFTRDKEEIVQPSNQITGILVESAPAASFTWYWSPNSSGTGRKPLPAFYTTANSSYMSVHRDSFPASVTNGRLICVVKTNELGCQREVTVPLTVKPRPTSGMASNAMTSASCGQPVKDARDGEIYTTVKVGNQCWMAENMRYKGNNNVVNGYNVVYPPADPKGTVLGVFYRARQDAVGSGICPTGWVIPSYNDMTTLIKVANNNGMDEYGRFRLRAGNFWLVGRDNKELYCNYIYGKAWNYGTNPTGFEEGFNTYGFGLMGSSYHTYDPKNGGYNYAILITRTIRSNPYLCMWLMHYSNYEFQYWNTNANQNFPIRCILQSTSVD